MTEIVRGTVVPRYHAAMGSWIRTLLVWLLVLAVPAQGAAAATLALCGPNHQGQPESVASADHHQHGHHSHGPVDQSDDADGVLAASDLDGDAPPAAPSPHTDSHKCSACAVCCAVAALLTTLPSLPAVEQSTTQFTAVVIAIEAFAVDGPERPPRPPLA